ncbi:hypothetical protein DL96DRAFT_1666497 [Flagelloscypha sp. PMI_526]|nr:hypothetical protein DL96DRAFT_1666497 [Flagelloscypha sp. PMI_526]
MTFKPVLDRAARAGVVSQLITGGSLKESKQALNLAKTYIPKIFIPLEDVIPTRSSEFDKHRGGHEGYLKDLDQFIQTSQCGLDYDRLHFASKEVQKKAFRSQLQLAKKHSLPLFLHSRNTAGDFSAILKEEGFGVDGGLAVGGRGGVVHSHTGSWEEAEELGHASRVHVNTLPSALRDLYFPPSRQPERFEAGKTVKGRNEPCTTGGVAWVIAQLKGVELQEVVDAAFENTVRVFGMGLTTPDTSTGAST